MTRLALGVRPMRFTLPKTSIPQHPPRTTYSKQPPGEIAQMRHFYFFAGQKNRLDEPFFHRLGHGAERLVAFALVLKTVRDVNLDEAAFVSARQRWVKPYKCSETLTAWPFGGHDSRIQ